MALNIVLVVLVLAIRKNHSNAVTALPASIEKAQIRNEEFVRVEFALNREETTNAARQDREESATAFRVLTESQSRAINSLSETLQTRLSEANTAQKGQLDTATATLTQALNELTRSSKEQFEFLRSSVESKLLAIQNDNSTKLEQIQQNVETKLTAMQADSAAKLEQIRLTVDEKLQSTLERRLSESFKSVSERLEQVHTGLGEMKALASGVGDLKKVLTNIKTRGNWGEVQLGNLLEQMLTPDQYAANVKVNPESGERVEFAIKLPGHVSDGEPVWLPIDAKFPQEDYQRLVEAAEQGDAAGIATHSAALEQRVFAEAKKIREKYIHPPHTTDFAILFLSTEALFAEILRKPGACDRMIAERVVLAGPTTLAALLNSLQMGFRTLVLEKRSSEVWKVLGAVKTEFSKFGDALKQVERKLHAASTAIGDVQVRSRVMVKKLGDVEQLPTEESTILLGLPPILISTVTDSPKATLQSEPSLI
jgi:DNA recombination protein RmuC